VLFRTRLGSGLYGLARIAHLLDRCRHAAYQQCCAKECQ
jgi:hypothetical protein